ncbi:MAG: PAS domain S-box protein, partial [Alphaproteobacteria bacterium]
MNTVTRAIGRIAGSRLKIRARFVLGFAAVCAILVGAAVVIIWRMGGVEAEIDRIAYLRVPTSISSARMANNINASLAALRGWMLTGDPSFKAKRSATWRDIDAVSADLDRLSAVWTNPDNVTRWTTFKATLDAFREAQQRVEDLAHSAEERPATTLLLTEGAPRAETMFREITAMIDEEAHLEAAPERKALLGIMADVRGMTAISFAHVRAYLLSGDPKFREQFTGTWSKSERRFGDLRANAHLLTPTQKKAFEALSAAREEFSALPPRMLNIRASAKWNMARYVLVTEAMPRAERLLEALIGPRQADGSRAGGMVANQGLLLAEEAHAADADIAVLKTIVLVLFSAGLATAWVIAGGILRSIVEPVRAITAAMSSLARGDTEVQVPARDRADEFGEMAESIQVFKADAIRRRQAEQRFRTLLDSTPDALVVIDKDGLITLANEQTERMFGYRREELLGQKVERLIPARYREPHLEHRNGYLADPRTRPMGKSTELYGLAKDGREIPVDISLSTIQTDEGTVVLAFTRDVTERRHAVEEMRLQSAVLDVLYRIAAIANETDVPEHAMATSV